MKSSLKAPATWIAFAALVVATSGVAFAAIPSSNGTITACYAQSSGFYLLTYHSKGDVRIIDASESCRGYETRITWKDGLQPPPSGGTAYEHAEVVGPLTPPTGAFPGGELVGGPALTITAPPGGGLLEVFASVDSRLCSSGVVGLVEAPNYTSDDHLGTKGMSGSSTPVTRGVPGSNSNGQRGGSSAILRVPAGPHTFKLGYWGSDSTCELSNMKIWGAVLEEAP